MQTSSDNNDWHVWELLKDHCSKNSWDQWNDAQTEVGEAETQPDDDDDFVWELLRGDYDCTDKFDEEDDATTAGFSSEEQEDSETPVADAEDGEEEDEEDEEIPECFSSPPLVRSHMATYTHLCSLSINPDFDLGLLTRLFESTGIHVEGPLPFALGQHFNAEPMEVACGLRLILRCFVLLHEAKLDSKAVREVPFEDIEVVAAHASAYFETYRAAHSTSAGKPAFGILQFSRTLAIMLFMASSYIIDGSKNLNWWHAYAFYGHRALNELSDDVWTLFDALKFNLRIEPEELETRLAFLRGSDALPANLGLIQSLL